MEDKQEKNKIIFEISKSDKMMHKFLSYLLKLNLYETYKYLYLFRKALS